MIEVSILGGRSVVAGQSVWSVVAPTGLTATLSTGLAISVNVATGGGHSVWAWVAVAVLTMGAFAVSLWIQQSAPLSAGSRRVAGVDLRNVKVGRDLRLTGIRSRDAGVRVRRVRVGQDMTVDQIDGHGGGAQS